MRTVSKYMNNWVKLIIIKYMLISTETRKKKRKKIEENFHKGKYKNMKKFLAKLDFNNMLRNKTYIENWNILK